MKIIYVAKHDSGGNDDEGAIAHALTDIGHKVERYQEHQGEEIYKAKGDLLLFHKWDAPYILEQLKGKMPRVFWYWDLVEMPDGDPSVYNRCQTRVTWMRRTMPHVELGFCSDGDWIAKTGEDGPSGKLVHLFQGADARYAGKLVPIEPDLPPILFTGISKGGGSKREAFVAEMKQVYGKDFHHIRTGCHGSYLAAIIMGSRVVVAPDSPTTDRYWSNRVYLMLGYGAYLIHPYCELLAQQYEHQKEIVFYPRGDMDNLHSKIRYGLQNREYYLKVIQAGMRRTLEEHTYTHRCRQLISTCRERGIL